MSDTLIKVDGLCKKFCLSLRKSLWYGLQDLGDELLGRRHGGNGELRPDEFWAVRDVSFELKRGECLGLVGRNGAGKTTLLRMLNGLIKPDQGRIEMRGRVGAIIALGAGFNPILTGRENIYVNSAILGLSKRETDEIIDEIIDFAEIGKFIDMPVQNYSSGMSVKLGFAAATVIEPDILLLDEVLAVGDVAFRWKCYRRMDQLREKAAVIFVSHDMASVARICDSTLLLSGGEVSFMGDTPGGVDAYRNLNAEESGSEGFISTQPPITELKVQGIPEVVSFNSPFPIEVLISSQCTIGDITLHIDISNLADVYLASCNVDSRDYGIQIGPGKTHWRIELASLPLKAGRYTVSIALVRSNGDVLAWWHPRHIISVTGGHVAQNADCQLDVRSWTLSPVGSLG